MRRRLLSSWFLLGALGGYALPAVADEGRPPNPAARAVDIAQATLAVKPAVRGQLREQIHDLGRGAAVVTLSREVEGIEVLGARASVVLDRSLRPVAALGTLHAELSPPPRAIAFALSARQVAVSALAAHGLLMGASELIDRGEEGRYRVFDAPERFRLSEPVRVKPVYYPTGGQLNAAYTVDLFLPDPAAEAPDLLALVVDADDGRILKRTSLRREAEPFRYRVYASADDLTPEASPFCSDGIPHPTGEPDGYLPLLPCSQQLIEPPAEGAAGPWLADDAEETVGNNVDAFFQSCTDPEGEQRGDPPLEPALGDFRARVTGPRTFDHTYDVSQAPNDCFRSSENSLCPKDQPQILAKIVQAFYVANYLHDLFYRHGFDEASGNAQQDNYGRGGRDGDPLWVKAGTCSTFAYPRPDGLSPMLYLGRNGVSGLARDATLDLGVFAHEWMHYMQGRLIGDSRGLGNPQGQALGEGWSDFLGLLVTVRAEDEDVPSNGGWNGAFTLGAYHNEGYCDPFTSVCVGPSDDQTYYFGIRRYPYTTDFTKNPLTFRFIANDVPLPAGISQYFWKGRIDNAEGHNAGEIWTVALWGGFVELLRSGRLGFAEAKERMAGYLVASMKATPSDPTFIEARDALLAVAQATDTEDHLAFKRAFAVRGLGVGAVSPPRDSIELQEVVESFVMEGPALSFIGAEASVEAARDGDADGVVDVGEQGVLSVHLRNSGDRPLADTRVSISAPGVVVVGGDTVSSLDSMPSADFTARFTWRLDSAGFDEEKRFTVELQDTAAGVAPRQIEVPVRVHYDLFAASSSDAVTLHTARDWSVEAYNGQRGGGYRSRDSRWRQVGEGADRHYRAPPGKANYESSLLSPWFKVKADEDLLVRFAEAYDFQRGDGTAYGSGSVMFATDADGFRTWTSLTDARYSRSEDYPALVTSEASAGRLAADRIVRFQFYVEFLGSLEELDTGWRLDDLSFFGVENRPFHAAYPHGSGGPPGNHPPQVDLSLSEEGMTVSFEDRSLDDGSIAARDWTFGDGERSTESAPVHTYSVPTDFVATLLVTDDEGAVAVTGRSVVARRPLENGVAYSGPFGAPSHFFIDVPDGARSLSVELSGVGYVDVSLRHGAPPIFFPYRVDEIFYGEVAAGGLPLQGVVADPAPGRWYLQVEGDNERLVARVELNEDPLVDFDVELDGLHASFVDRSTSAATLTSWRWDFGDGSTATEPSPEHTYRTAGSYLVRLVVTDDRGGEAEGTRTIEVRSGEEEQGGCGCSTSTPSRSGHWSLPQLVALVLGVGAFSCSRAARRSPRRATSRSRRTDSSRAPPELH